MKAGALLLTAIGPGRASYNLAGVYLVNGWVGWAAKPNATGVVGVIGMAGQTGFFKGRDVIVVVVVDANDCVATR